MTKQTNVALTTTAIFIATFMTAIEGTIVSTAMPTIIGSLHGVELMNWVFSIFLLTSAMATPIYGKFADRNGRKPVFILGLIVFVVGSSLCGLAQNMLQLIIFRALQGIGAGAIQPITFTIIADIFPFEKRARVLGLNGSAWGVASVIAPLLGGFLVEKLSWHWIFFINLPVGLLTILLVVFYYHEDFQKSQATIDWRGSFWLLAMLLSLMLAFQMLGQTLNWPVIFSLLAVTAFSGWRFFKQEQAVPDPILNLKMLHNRTFMSQNMIALFISGFLISFEVYMPMWVQAILGLPPTRAGFVVTPSSVLWIVGSFVAGKLILKYRPQQILTGALLWLMVGGLVLATNSIAASFSWFLVWAGFMGLAFGIIITTTTVTIQNVVPHNQVGVATSLNTLARTLGQTLLVSVYGIVMNRALYQGTQTHAGVTTEQLNQLIDPLKARHLPVESLPVLRGILYNGLHAIYIVAAAIILLALGVNWYDQAKRRGELRVAALADKSER
ncbi:major facilitator superfamily permease [Agrilactobacillus composti DSM 18527 = JCM 14202]|uniref:Major facilitator superfamily permease n=2 Tax=Agrilactobacillus TaxID=2767875 RepID=A0A0R1Y368_9LACO|nr:major facilitator superfamily permease [Agrilactobacillus composti DSM 18527 = JCM 14202]